MGKQYQPRTTTSSSMAHIGIIALAITAFVTVVTPECCIQKNYGGEMYTLRGPEEMQEYPCKDGCYYTKDGMPGSRFCFKKGGPIMSTCDISKCTQSDCYVGNPCCDPVTSPCTENKCFPPAPVPAPVPAGCTPGDCTPDNRCCDPVTSPCTDNECFPPAPVPAPVPAPMGMGDHGSGGMGDHSSDGMGDHSSDGMGDHNSGGMDGGMGMGDHGRK